MARKVKCQATGEWGTSDVFVKINGKYYKSQETYDALEEEKKCKAKIVMTFKYEFLGLGNKEPIPKFIYSELKSLEYYPYKVILETIEYKKPQISKALNRMTFKSEFLKTRYIFAIISNGIPDVYRKYKQAERMEKIQNKEACVEACNTVDMDIAQTPVAKKKRNISNWLGDDDL